MVNTPAAASLFSSQMDWEEEEIETSFMWEPFPETVHERLQSKLVDWKKTPNHVMPLEISAECGDDLIVVSDSMDFCAGLITTIETTLGMKISEKDTSLTRGVGTFAEGIVKVPTTYQETWTHYRNTRSEGTFSYIDTPKIRLVLPTSSQRKKFSDTISGKFNDLGGARAWLSIKNRTKLGFEIASLIQDALIGAIVQKEPAYISRELGGGGKLLPFKNPGNFFRFFKSYKRGRYYDYFQELVRSVNDFVRTADDGSNTARREIASSVLKRAAMFEKRFTSWVKGLGIMVPIIDLEIRERFKDEFISVISTRGHERYYASRLIQQRAVVCEADLAIGIAHNDHINAYLSTDNFLLAKEVLSQARTEWKESLPSQYDYYIENLAKNFGFKDVQVTPEEVSKFYSNLNETGISISKLLREDCIYARSALDKVYIDGPMNVKTGMGLTPFSPFQSMPQHVIATTRRDIEETETIGLVDRILEWFAGDRSSPGPTKWINDDPILIQSARAAPEECAIGLVTADLRLCREMAIKTGRTVLRIPVPLAYAVQYREEGEWEKILPSTRKWHILTDSGAMESGEELYFRHGEFFPHSFVRGNHSLEKDWFAVGQHKMIGDPADLFEGPITIPVGWPGHRKFNFLPGVRLGLSSRYNRDPNARW